MGNFKTMNIPDLLRAMRYCQSKKDGECYQCGFYKKEVCPGEVVKNRSSFFDELVMEQREQM